jgi:selenocysteine-specific elongation factor
MNHITLAVMGHVDHGKTSLVKALTGIETDTLKEEKTRGLSIRLGFAHLRDDAQCVHLIDTPGHADFIRMTASGVSGAQAVLLVVSAVDGIRPQTREHLKLAHLFGVRSVLVALTKSDLSNAETTARTRKAIGALLEELNLDCVEQLVCSSNTGEGIDALRLRLLHFSAQGAQTPDLKGVFLPIDRVFSAPGAGTIVTGTLLGHALQVEDTVNIGPSHKEARVRSLQLSGLSQESAPSGARVAVNLRDVDREEIARGDVLSTPGAFTSSQRLDVVLSKNSTLKHMDHVVLLLGTAHVAARMRLYPRSDDQDQFAQLEITSPLTAYPGQRFVLRQPAGGETVTGGIVLDPNASLITRNKPAHVALLNAIQSGTPDELAYALADRDKGIVDLSLLHRLSDARQLSEHADFETTKTGQLVRCAEVQALATALTAYLQAQHAARPIAPYIDFAQVQAALRPAPETLIAHVLDQQLAAQEIRQSQSGLALTQHDPIAAMTPEQRTTYTALEARLLDMGVQPVALFDQPTREEKDFIALLIAQGRAVSLYNHSLKQSLLLHRDAIEKARERLQAAFANGAPFKTSDARIVLNTNRKTIVPLLEHFDTLGLTDRSGDKRTFRI